MRSAHRLHRRRADGCGCCSTSARHQPRRRPLAACCGSCFRCASRHRPCLRAASRLPARRTVASSPTDAAASPAMIASPRNADALRPSLVLECLGIPSEMAALPASVTVPFAHRVPVPSIIVVSCFNPVSPMSCRYLRITGTYAYQQLRYESKCSRFAPHFECTPDFTCPWNRDGWLPACFACYMGYTDRTLRIYIFYQFRRAEACFPMSCVRYSSAEEFKLLSFAQHIACRTRNST